MSEFRLGYLFCVCVLGGGGRKGKVTAANIDTFQGGEADFLWALHSP